MKYEGIIFDLDGTLIDSLNGLAKSMNNVLKRHNYPCHRVETYRDFIGWGLKELTVRALPEKERDEDIINLCLKELNDQYEKNWSYKMTLYNGIPEFLDRLQSYGIKMAVLSNKEEAFTHKITSKMLRDWDFVEIVGASDRIPRKPEPDGALMIAEKMNIKTDKIVYMGDSAIDMKTANAAGMLPVGVLWGFRDAETLLDGGAEVLLKKPAELKKLFFT